MLLQDVILSVNSVDKGGKRIGMYSKSTVHCSMTLDMAYFQNPQYGVWRSSSIESSHQVLMKQISTTSVTVCFKKGTKEQEKLPPTRKSLEQHINREHYQAKVWHLADAPLPDFESPVGSGWYDEATTGDLHPQLSVDDPLPKEFTDILYCKCTHCKTAKNLKYTGACACHDGICHNPYSVVIESDSD